MVAGLAQPGRRWHRVASRLADAGFTAVTFDNRGCRTAPCKDFDLADCAADVLELADSLGHERFALAGLSMGGMIAQEVLAAAPGRVTAAVLLATHSGGPDVVPPPDLMILVAPHPREMWSRLVGPGFAEAHPDVIEEEAQLSLDADTPVEGIMSQLQAILRFDPGLDSSLEVPVVVGHGDHDPLLPYENGVRLAKRLGCELVTYDGAGHALEFERPDEVASLIAEHARRSTH